MKTFEELFENALFYQTIDKPKNDYHKATMLSYYNLAFNIWLQENKGWEYGNEEQYIQLLTKENWREFIADEMENTRLANAKFEIDKRSWQGDRKAEIELSIFYFMETKWCIPFRTIYHTIETTSNFVRPIFPAIEPLKYIDYFLRKIDFEKIDESPSKDEILNYCNAIYYGLEEMFKRDIEVAVLDFQNKISQLTKDHAIQIQKKGIEIVGNLKRQARNNGAETRFTKVYTKLYKTIEAKQRIHSFDYQILIGHFNEIILNDLLSSYEIILQTLKDIIPMLTNSSKDEFERTPDKSRTRELIEVHFEEMRGYAFQSDTDYNSFLELLTNFFEYKTYRIPSKPIQLRRGSKTKIATVFNSIHKELSEVKLRSDYEYLKIIQTLSPFSKTPLAGIYKEITR